MPFREHSATVGAASNFFHIDKAYHNHGIYNGLHYCQSAENCLFGFALGWPTYYGSIFLQRSSKYVVSLIETPYLEDWPRVFCNGFTQVSRLPDSNWGPTHYK